MMLNKQQIDKLIALEEFRFEEGIRFRLLRDAVQEKWHGKCESDEDFQTYMRELDENDGPPWWNMACCTKMMDHQTVITDDGHVTMTWTVEFDPESIRLFEDGCRWANEHGAGIPL